MNSTHTPQRTVKSFEAEQTRSGQWPLVLLHYTDGRGYRKTSQCKFNDVASAERHGRNLLGRVMQ